MSTLLKGSGPSPALHYPQILPQRREEKGQAPQRTVPCSTSLPPLVVTEQPDFSTLVRQAVTAAIEGLSQRMALLESAVGGLQEENEEAREPSPAPSDHSGASGSSSERRGSPPPPVEVQRGTREHRAGSSGHPVRSRGDRSRSRDSHHSLGRSRGRSRGGSRETHQGSKERHTSTERHDTRQRSREHRDRSQERGQDHRQRNREMSHERHQRSRERSRERSRKRRAPSHEYCERSRGQREPGKEP